MTDTKLEVDMAWLGFVVKEKSEEHPRGSQVSGRLQTLAGAEEMKKLFEKTAAKEGRKAQYYISELVTKT